MINFPFGINGKSIILSVPILKHISVFPLFEEPYFAASSAHLYIISSFNVMSR